MNSSRRGARLGTLFLLILTSPLSGSRSTPDSHEAPPREVATLSIGTDLERPIAPGEAHTFRLPALSAPALLLVEQRSVDVVLELGGPVGDRVGADSGEGRWGPDLLLLEAGGERRVTVRAKALSGWPGRYRIRVEPLSAESAAPARLAAWSALDRAGRAAYVETPESRRAAISAYGEALAAWKGLGDRRWEAEAEHRLATLQRVASEPRPASEGLERAANLWRELGEETREAAARNDLGLALRDTGGFEAARAALETALTLWRKLGQRYDEAEARSNVCLLEQTVGDLAAARACYQEPLALFREAGDANDESRLLNNLGGILEQLGEPDAALEHYGAALALRRTLGDLTGQAQCLNNLAVLHRSLGDWQEALRLYGEVREMVRRTGDRSLEAPLLNNLGYTYMSLGEPQRALPLLGDALRLRREIGDRRGEVATLNNLGLARRRLGEIQASLDLHAQALERAASLGDGRLEAISRLRRAEALLEGGDAASALLGLTPALASLRKAGLRQGELQALLLQGQALLKSGRPVEAIAALEESLAGRRTLRDRSGEAEALGALAAAERGAGRLDAARAHAEEAVARVEELRTGFASPDLRAAFLATRRRAYSLLIDLLVDRHQAEPASGWDRAALAVSERARARSLLDALSAGDPRSPAESSPAAVTPLVQRRETLRRRLSVKAEQQLRQANGKKAEELGREIEALLAEIDSIEGEIRRADPKFAAFSRPAGIGLPEIAALFEPGTLFLEMSLGEERSHLWLVEGAELRTFPLPPLREVETLARQVHADLSTVEAGGAGREAALQLSRLLLGPIWSRVAGAKRLVIVPDGALHLVPLGALPAPDGGGRPLLESLEVDYLPSATTLAELRRRPASPPSARRAAIFADPVFSADDLRLDRSSGKAVTKKAPDGDPMRGGAEDLTPPFERLPASGREAEAIAALAPPGEVWIARDFAASREAVLSPELRSFRTLHFATHAVADTRTSELSGLVLSQIDSEGKPREGFLSLAEIYDLRLAADLVVLSGCRTALGKEVRGEGLVGLTRGFLYAGVPRVVASLWPVQDRAATELMTRFYRALWLEGKSPSAALREAQLAVRRDPRYRDPFHWAGYVLVGDWR